MRLRWKRKEGVTSMYMGGGFVDGAYACHAYIGR